MDPFHRDAPFADAFRKTTIMGSAENDWALPREPERIRDILSRIHELPSWSFDDGEGVADPVYRFTAAIRFDDTFHEIEGLFSMGDAPGFFFENYSPRLVWALTREISRQFPQQREFVICFDEFRCLNYRVTDDLSEALRSLADDFDMALSKALYPLNFADE